MKYKNFYFGCDYHLTTLIYNYTVDPSLKPTHTTKPVPNLTRIPAQ